ncbi:hypothetical protein TNCV_2840191 [Trichonephila clavipes]|uniref:Tc1-like transposase DDE domain-containing protein n=1 Tax=Trichonephila clavipes TaxID=2585209 RepID=A0A8X6RRK0_TRICX|nr:hypothetical protein TNCV_2840191 [Trichonephila clavipes]
MENRKETTIEERKLFIKLSNGGKSLRNSAKVVGRSVNCIQKILQKFKKTGMLANNEGRARKKINELYNRAKKWLLYHCRNQLNTPPQSPDLNVIENLWPHLERAVQRHPITSKEQLKSVLKEEWLNIAPETTKTSCGIDASAIGSCHISKRLCY